MIPRVPHALATLTLLVSVVCPPASSASLWTTDEAGRRFRLRFDDGRRWTLGGAWSGSWSTGESSATLARVESSLRYRARLDFPAEGVSWKLYHRTLDVALTLDGRDPRRARVLAYEGIFTRWMQDGWITIPTSPPKRLPFPLNIGLRATVGELEVDLETRLTEIAVLETAIVFDFWRSRELGSYAQLELGPGYGLRLIGGGELVHVVAPFSAVAADVHHEWESGRQSINARLEAAWRWSSRTGWGPDAAVAVSYELVFLAVNDHPLSLYGEAGWRFRGDVEPDKGQHDVRLATGLRVGWPL